MRLNFVFLYNMSKLTSITRNIVGSNVEQFSLLRIAGNRYMSDDSKGKKRGKTPIGKLDQTETTEKDESADVYAPFPDNKNPVTGEIGGPRGPEPTRYGDWERKGRVTDF